MRGGQQSLRFFILSFLFIKLVQSLLTSSTSTRIQHCTHKNYYCHPKQKISENASTEEAHNNNNNNIISDARWSTQNRLVIFGLGNIGTLVASTASALGMQDRNNNNNNNNNNTTSFSSKTSASYFEHVCGTTRSHNTEKKKKKKKEKKEEEKKKEEEEEEEEEEEKEIPGVQTIPFDDYQELSRKLQRCTHVLITIPPVMPSTGLDCRVVVDDDDEDEDIVIGGRRRIWKYFCDPVLNHPKLEFTDLVPTNAWIGYISSTSVYGNHNGDWVTEESDVKCKAGSKAELYLRAENEWRDAACKFGWRLHIFRASGIYGNSRSALHTVRNGNFVFDESAPLLSLSNTSSFTSRIHEDDITRAILLAMTTPHHPVAGETSCLWNLADDCPASRSEVMMFSKSLLEEAKLPSLKSVANNNCTTPAAMQTERARRRSTDLKRVRNDRMKKTLLTDGQLIYPSYRDGLKSILAFNREKWSSQ